MQQLLDDVQYQVIVRGDDADVLEDAAVLRDYFNLQACLKDLCQDWSSRDNRFRNIYTYFPGTAALFQRKCKMGLHGINQLRNFKLSYMPHVAKFCWFSNSENTSVAQTAFHSAMLQHP